MTAGFALLDTPGGGALLFEDLLETLPLSAGRAVADVCMQAEARAAAACFVVAAIDYELGYRCEPKAGPQPVDVGGHFWVFARQRRLDAASLAAFLRERCGDPLPPAALLDFVPTLAEAEHAAAVSSIRSYIAAGDCYQVNFTFPFTGRCLGDPLALYARLRAAQPVAHGGVVMTPEACILSFSPELFVAREAGKIRSRPMKGTAARHSDAGADAAAAEALRNSAKDRAENVMIVDLIRSDLGRIARPGSVRVPELCAIEAYPSVYQMSSEVCAESAAPLHEVLQALFPCGSITGAPKVRAMQIIGELEPAPRGLYTGALGWIGAGGDFSLSVAIRTLRVESSGDVRYGVGSGIVWDSSPAAEYRECLLKAAFLRRADPGFRLIETMRLDDGVFPMLAMHLDRLQSSAGSFGFRFERAAAEASLLEFAGANRRGCLRVRLTLGHEGDVEIQAFPLEPVRMPMRAVLSPDRLDSGDGWLRHKTTVRARYDDALRRATADPGVFDAIFLNERGEVCEGARSNVFLRRRPGEPLLTPPLSSGLLPGVLRRQLLADGDAVEVLLCEEDLRSAAELYLGNALRGLIRVSL